MISSFSVTGRGKEKREANFPPVDDNKMAALASEMERELSNSEGENSDPRKLARMIRMMSNASGETVPTGMQEMMRRLEAGEDPEKLEAEYGEMFDAFENAEEKGEDLIPGEGVRSRHRSTPPQRDPALYDMGDYLP